MPKYRPGQVGFEQSMQHVVSVETRDDVARAVSAQLQSHVSPEELTFEYFGRDQRNDWSTWVVYLAGYGPVGFTTRCLDPNYRQETSRWGSLEEPKIPAD
jgi:D-serine deaminase-like pyridoxal phosphate-dependent protein